jgi:thiamine-phosphate pyrophosphorylase
VTPRLVAISDRRSASASTTLERFDELGRLARPRSVVFQLRDLELGARERRVFAGEMSRVARKTEQFFVVNDRVDLAVLSGADGVHLGERGVDTPDARKLLDAKAFVSRACHDPAEVASLEADAVLLSPILAARKGRPALGLDALSRAKGELERAGRKTLLFALGGVSANDAAACVAAGAWGVAVIGAVLRGEASELVRVLGLLR